MNKKPYLVDVFRSNQFTEAWLVKELLNQHGIPAQVLGEYLAGGLGELPLDAPVRVRVASEDEPRAVRLLEETWYEKSFSV